ncbi:hypothetical protein [Kordia sp.]|uniref:hypothetical protein n=1 Tax=Kordia sp. TaxID=1965332 RepID=UPI003B5A1926
MTHIYQWFSFPKTYAVTCPKCSSKSQGTDLLKEKNLHGIKHYYKPESIDGVFTCNITCTSCGYHKETDIQWPRDAYWQFNIHGNILWAWSEAHAAAILAYINAKNRDEFQSEFAASLFRIPAYFKQAKHRELIVKKIRKQLQVDHSK